MAFYVGQKVVCIDCVGQTKSPYAQEGVVYTVSRVYKLYYTYPALELWELPLRKGAWWPQSKFRPVVSRPTSISIFTAMLGSKQKETIDG